MLSRAKHLYRAVSETLRSRKNAPSGRHGMDFEKAIMHLWISLEAYRYIEI